MDGPVLYPPGWVIPSAADRLRMQLRPFHFLRLPGEIRNRVYHFLFDEYRVLVRGNHPQKELQQARKNEPSGGSKAPQQRYRLWCSFETHIMAQNPPSYSHSLVPLEVLQTCRTMYHEATPFLYARMALRFESTKVLAKFLDRTPPQALACITRIELIHSTYGEPEDCDHRRWKQQHNAKWLRLCTTIGKKMTDLKEIKVDLWLCDWPTQLEVGAKWTRPLLAMKGTGLEDVKIFLRSKSFSEERLQSFATKLEMEMMSEQGIQKRKDKEQLAATKVKKLRPMRTAKTLRIILPTPNGQLAPKGGVAWPTINPKFLKQYSCIEICNNVW